MKITYDWLKDHLKTSAKEGKLLEKLTDIGLEVESCLLYTSPSPRDATLSRMPSSA